MKRRTFLSQFTLGAMGLACSGSVLRGVSFPYDLYIRKDIEEWPNLGMEVPEDVSYILNLTSDRENSTFLKGASIASIINGFSQVGCIEFVSDPGGFSDLKRKLVKSGVVGIPQPNAPRNTIQFEYGDRTYFCEALSLDSFLQRNAQGILSSRMLFKHSSLLFQPYKDKMWDPYGICDRKPPIFCDLIKNLDREPTIVRCVATLQSQLELHHFRIPQSVSVVRLEKVWEEAAIVDNAESEIILLTFLDYACDIADTFGLDALHDKIRSNLIRGTIQNLLEVDAEELIQVSGRLSESLNNRYSRSTLLLASIIALNTRLGRAYGYGLPDVYQKSSYASTKQRTLMLAVHLAQSAEVQTIISEI